MYEHVLSTYLRELIYYYSFTFILIYIKSEECEYGEESEPGKESFMYEIKFKRTKCIRMIFIARQNL